MSEKQQNTATHTMEKMLLHYGEDLFNRGHPIEHKHNKYHLQYRKHWRSHPCTVAAEGFKRDKLNGRVRMRFVQATCH